MRVLLLHPNFPGQFRQRALDWAEAGHDVQFLCQTHYGRQLPGVKRLCLKHEAGHEHLESLGLKGANRAMAMAEQYQAGFRKLKRLDWSPDIVVSHTGWGCGLHASSAFPDARRLGYVEWWFKTNKTIDLGAASRNMPMALELVECDQLISPTEWQKNQLPLSLRARCLVIGDGVDVNLYQPNPSMRTTKPLLTYGTRGMEPTRGFTEFIGALPAVLKSLPGLEVEIAGEDQICYAGTPPSGFPSYGVWAREMLKPWQGRVKFVGTLNPDEYRLWLQRSWFHVYLTKPFVASWSLLESMASGCCLIASDTPPVREFTGEEGARLVKGWERENRWLLRVVQDLLTKPEQRRKLEKSARTLATAWSQEVSRYQWGRVLDQRLASGC